MDKTVLVTGANRGIGAAIARRFAKEGFRVAINCRNEVSVEKGGAQVLADCRALGAEAEIFLCDVSDFAACGEMVKAVKERFGGVDVLVNNAGITRDNFLARMSEEQFDAVIAANLKSAFNMMRHVTPLMMKKRSGHIVNMASVAGLYGNASQVNYAASKAGIVAMTKSAAKELGGRNIICNAVAPGPVESDMTDVLPAEVKGKMISAISLGRFGKAEEVADTVLFLAQTAYITGQVIAIDGGMSM